MLDKGTALGRYCIVHLLGEGGFGEVYLAEDTLIQRNVAVKVIKPQQSPKKLQDAMRLFQREMKAIARLDHPHILPLYDFGEATVNGTKYAFMVMPYCKDGTLETWLDERKDNHFPFPSLYDVAQILSQAADALQQAHDHPDTMLHLDVKPANFLIRQNKENPNCPYLLLADFGVAKFVDASAEFSTTVRGSIEYMPSEQSRSNPQCASDQYALALMIYKILTYQLPFKGNYAQLLYQHLDVIPAAPSTFNSRVPPEIDAVIRKALAKNYEERYSTITAFADAFKQALIINASTRVILSISKTEAETGGSYPLILADRRQITVALPPGVQDGQEIRQEGLGFPTYDGGPIPALITTIVVKPESESERKIASQLQSLEQKIQQLSQDIATLQTNIEHITNKPKELSPTPPQSPTPPWLPYQPPQSPAPQQSYTPQWQPYQPPQLPTPQQSPAPQWQPYQPPQAPAPLWQPYQPQSMVLNCPVCMVKSPLGTPNCPSCHTSLVGVVPIPANAPQQNQPETEPSQSPASQWRPY